MRKFIIMGMVALLALSFGPATHVTAQGKVVRLTLIDENGSGEDGSAQITDLGNGTSKVELIMLNAPDGAEQPAHIHKGTCANLDTNPAFPLETVKNSKSTTIVQASLADLTKEKYAINVHKSAAEISVYISCGNLPSAAVVSGQPMTMDQVLTTLLDNANELLGTIKKQEVDGSQNAYDAYHATFAAHEDEIKAKSADTQAKLEDAMHGVSDALKAGKWDDAEKAAEELVNEVKAAQTTLAGSSLTDAFQKLQTETADIVRETTNKDKDGSQAAYDAFHETFAANEEAIKAKDAPSQAEIEDAMHGVRDALAASDWEEAAGAAKELQTAVKEAADKLGGATTTTGATGGTGMSSTTATDTLAAAGVTMLSQANDLVRETANKDKDGALAAYDAFHTTFAANEDAIKAKNAAAQANIEEAMHGVRDALQASDWTKASAASKELVDTVTEANAMVAGGSGGSSLPTSGDSFVPTSVALAALALGLVAVGAASRRRAAR
ncbi:MAG: hypothetical protein ABI670_16100 [Chloroflexota bacterium]